LNTRSGSCTSLFLIIDDESTLSSFS